VEEGYFQVVEKRGVDPSHEVLQIFTNPFELKLSESREESACWQRRTTAFLVWARSRGFE